ncbi:MAG: alpha-glucosidase [Allopontixanthobacter sediminis]
MNARFVAVEGGFDLMWSGRALLAHRQTVVGDPARAVTCGMGEPTVEMHRGNFRIDDHYTPLPVGNAIEVSTTRVSLGGRPDTSPDVELEILQTASGFALEITTNDPSCNRLALEICAATDESIWGGGEQMSYLRLNGRRYPMWTSEPGVGRDKARELTRIMDEEGMAGGDFWTTNYPQPTYISSALYACHLDSTAWSALDFSNPARHRIEVWEGRAKLEFFFADSLPSLVGALSDRFGRAAPLPEWVVEGAIVGLKNGEQSLTRLEKIRAAGAAVSALWCEDWVGVRETSFGRRLFWDWRWRSDRYPDLPNQIESLNREGIRFLGYVNPYLAVDGGQYAEAAELGYLALQSEVDAPYIVDFGEFDCGIVDFTNPLAAEWFADRIIGREMLDFGLSGWMADFGEYLPTDLRLHDGSDPMLAHNLWPVPWAEVNARAIASRGKTGDATFFMRAGFTGVQAYCPLLWAGDQCVDFSRHDGIGTTIVAALSSGLLGNSASHSDLGGYTSLHGLVRTAELLMRWAELSAFTPVMRSHEGNRPDDNLQVDSTPEILAHFAAMSRVHAGLAPYMRHLIAEAARSGLPLQRPMFLHYADQVEFADCQDQYLLGPDLLVAPVLEEGARERTVLIPQDSGDWVNLWSGERLAGGRHGVAAPLGSPPVFMRADSAFAEIFAALVHKRGSISPEGPLP